MNKSSNYGLPWAFLCVIQEGYGAADTFQAYQKAYDLCLDLGKDPSPPVLRGLIIAGLLRGEVEQSYQYGIRLLNQAEKQQDAILLTGPITHLG